MLKHGYTAIAAWLILASGAAAQDLIVDWPNRSINCPAEISSSRQVKTRVQDANDLLYAYRVDWRETRRATDDFALLGGAKTSGPAGNIKSGLAPRTCDSSIAGAEMTAAAIAAKFDARRYLHPKRNGALFESFTLQQTLEHWRDFRADAAAEIDTLRKAVDAGFPLCTEPLTSDQVARIATLKERLASLDEWDRKANGNHIVEGPSLTLRADHDYTFIVVETRDGTETEGGRMEYTCKPASGALTLSAGSLFSTLSSLDFQKVKAPNLTTNDAGGPVLADGTNDVLTVNNASGVTPHAVVMLNYNIWSDPKRDWGFSFSSGPAFRLAGQTEASALGYFAGVSVNLWKRLFVTPGVHVGQYTDFPPNLFEGAIIPQSFGALTPTKRWTGRFGISLSYQTGRLNRPDVNGTANNLPAVVSTPPLKIKTAALNDAPVGKSYLFTLQPEGGKPPYTWKVLSGIPDWLSLEEATGKLTGAPPATAPDSAVIAIQLSDSNKATVKQDLTLTVTGKPPTITTESLKEGTVGVDYGTVPLTAKAGAGSYEWTVEGLPEGMAHTEGEISGTPKAAGDSEVKIVVQDKAGNEASVTLPLKVKPAANP